MEAIEKQECLIRDLCRAGQQEVLRDGGPQQGDGPGEAAVAREQLGRFPPFLYIPLSV